MTDSVKQLEELISLHESDLWDYRFYTDTERNGQLTLEISQAGSAEYVDIESAMIENISRVFDATEYEVTAAQEGEEPRVYIKFYGVEIAAGEHIITGGSAE